MGGELALLRQNEPNPFRDRTRIHFVVPEAANVTVELFDVAGREVATLLRSVRETPGEHAVDFDRRMLPSGVYLYRLRIGPHVETRRMTVLR
jgi:hypothetical protein